MRRVTPSTSVAAAATTADPGAGRAPLRRSRASSSERVPEPPSTGARCSTTSACFDEQLFLSWRTSTGSTRRPGGSLVPLRALRRRAPRPGRVVGEWRAALERRNKAIVALKGLPLPLLALYLTLLRRAGGVRDACRSRGAWPGICAGSRLRDEAPRALRRRARCAAARACASSGRCSRASPCRTSPRDSRGRERAGCARRIARDMIRRPGRRRRASSPACRRVRCTRWAATSPALDHGQRAARGALDLRAQARERGRAERERSDAGRDQRRRRALRRHRRRRAATAPGGSRKRRADGAAPVRTWRGRTPPSTTTAATAPPPQAARPARWAPPGRPAPPARQVGMRTRRGRPAERR